jgi:hypothetical protein
MFCQQCGMQLVPDVHFCGGCGAACVPPEPPAESGDIGQDAGMRLLLPVGRSVLAIIAGYLGLISVLLIPAPFALLVGILAVYDIRRNPKKHGMGRAIFGIVMGAIGTLLLLLLLLSVALASGTRH